MKEAPLTPDFHFGTLKEFAEYVQELNPDHQFTCRDTLHCPLATWQLIRNPDFKVEVWEDSLNIFHPATDTHLEGILMPDWAMDLVLSVDYSIYRSTNDSDKPLPVTVEQILPILQRIFTTDYSFTLEEDDLPDIQYTEYSP